MEERYIKVNEKLLRFQRNKKFLIFDFETEGLNLVKSRPWDLSYIICSLNEGIIKESENMIDWPNLSVPPEVARLCGFDRFVYNEKKKPAKGVFEQFIKDCSDVDYVCGHNILGFDSHIYINSCMKLGIEYLDWSEKILDTRPLLLGTPGKLNIPYKFGENLLDYQLRILSIEVRKRGYATLNALCDEMGVEYDKEKAHRAIYDCKTNWEALKQLLYKIEL